MPTIVVVNVSQQVAPTPSTLQQTGGLISQGGTNTAPGTVSLLTQASDFTSLVEGSHPNSTLTWAANVATVTTASPHGITTGDTVPVVISGVTPAGYNGTFAATSTGANTFTYPLAVNPGGSASVPGVYTLEDVGELTAMVTTFFAQGNTQSVYILELGPGDAADGVTFLTTYIINNPTFFYGYLVPRSWADEPTYQDLLASYQAPDKKTYFWTTVTLANYTNFGPLQKDVIALVEAPSIPATEFSLAAPFYVALHYNPNATNKVTPFNYSFLFGVTPYPTIGNGALLQTLYNYGVNFVSTGAQGGISDAMLFGGKTMDLRPFNYWYSADWVQIQQALNLSNAIINGSNNPINPLYYNQDGINRLQAVAAQVMANGVTFGLVLFPPIQTELDGPALTQNIEQGLYLGKTVVNAIPFITYSAENPGHYKVGLYNGLSTTYVPVRGFDQITFNLVISDFVAA